MLLRGRDANKDQSYFLYRLTQEQLAYALFPIGDLKKSDVRALAKKYGLPNAERPDSQGICFLGEVTMEEFLARYIPLSRGAVLDMRGETIGEHAGAALYTVGQRHGFTFWNEGDKKYPERAQRVEGVAQQYVTSIDTRANTITVSENKLDAARKEVVLRETHWINSVELPLRAEAEARYRETPVPVSVGKYGDDVIVTFGTPHIAAAGQSIVLYSGDTCHGGGIIC